MFRNAILLLKDWFQSPIRKPMVLRGARQVGKTWVVRHFAKEQGLNLLELNFEKIPHAIDFFQTNNVEQIIRNLEAYFGLTINLNNCLLFLDEIQAAPILLAKLRWFFEDMPELAVLAAGSLLDFALEKHSFSMPVGRISYLYMQPMAFEEFLLATGRETQLEYLQTWDLEQQIPKTLHDTLNAAVKEFVLVGGMPEAVKAFAANKSLIAVAQIQQDLLTNFRDDFNKYETRIDKNRLDEILRTIPNLLSCKFKYTAVNQAASTSVIKHALELLITARIVHKVNSCAATGLPLGANINTKMFKALLLDIGLVSALLKLALQPEMLQPNFTLDNSAE